MDVDLARHQMASNNTPGTTIDHNQVEHFRTGVHGHTAVFHLTFKSLIGSEKKLLSSLSAGVKGSRNLCAAKRTVGQRAAVFAGKWNALRYTLINDFDADLGQAVNVGLTRTEIPAFHGVVKKPVNAIPVILVVLRGVDPALC